MNIDAYVLFMPKAKKIVLCRANDTSVDVLTVCPTKEGCEALRDQLALEKAVIKKVKVVIEEWLKYLQ